MLEKLTNCPNCNGRLNEAGRCEFCGSKIYDFLTIDFNDRNMPSAKTYVRLKANGKIVLAPVRVNYASYDSSSDCVNTTADITGENRYVCTHCYPTMNINFVIIGDTVEVDSDE